MHSRPEIVFTFPACMGGVASFNFNIINNSKLLKNFRSKVILMSPKEDTRAHFTEKFAVDETIVFNYSYKENQYHVQKRLNKLLGDAEGALVTDNSLTIIAAKRFGNPKTIFSLLHDYYYVGQTLSLGDLADVCIAHSSFFSDVVFSASPQLFAGRSLFIPYGVAQLDVFPEKDNKILNLVFIGRLEDSKGVLRLYEIEQLLVKNNTEVNWTIIGKGHRKQDLERQWADKKNVKFLSPATTAEVYENLKQQDVFVFPTSYEGTPVSILECLANGVVTITNDLPGGIRDIVTDGIGFRCQLDDMEAFAGHIVSLNSNRDQLKIMQRNCFQLAHNSYDIVKNADNYFAWFERYKELKRPYNGDALPRMSRLDKEYIPNGLVRKIRSLR